MELPLELEGAEVQQAVRAAGIERATQALTQFGQVALGFAGIALINIGFVFGFGALVWVYSSEAFPARLRAYGSSAMLTADLVANWIIANFFLSAMEKVGGAASFGFFAVMALLAWIFVWKLAPETKGRELEEIRHYWENGGSWESAEDTKIGS